MNRSLTSTPYRTTTPLALAAVLALPALARAAEAGHGEAEEISAIPGWEQAFIPALFTLIIFSVVVAVLGKYAWGPIAAGLQEREDKIRRDIEEAERARAEAEAKQREYAAQLDTAEAKVRELMAEAQRNAEGVVQKAKMDAQTEAESIKDRASRDIETSRVQAVASIREEAATLATMVAEKILRREINADDQKRLVQESLDALDQLDASGNGAVATARPTSTNPESDIAAADEPVTQSEGI